MTTSNTSNTADSDRSEWLSKCRSVLIEMETKNIRQRALSWTQIVNTETQRIHEALGMGSGSESESTATASGRLPEPYSYTVPSPRKYLHFLTEWSGIKSRSASSSPSCYVEFESKAKNWLNGRRAPNYGNTLFPDMLSSAERFSSKMAHTLFGSVPIDVWSAAPRSSSLCTLYQKALLFGLIEKLCCSRIAVHQNWKKTNLLCENSVKNHHSKTAKLLQQYALHDHPGGPDLHSFPGNLQRAAAFFQQQHSKYMQRLTAALNDRGVPPKTEQNAFSSATGPTTSGSPDSARWSAHGLGARAPSRSVHGGSPLVAMKERDYQAILQRLGALEQRHNDQALEISKLTAQCTALQSRLQSNACCALTIPSASNPKTLTSSPSTCYHSVPSAHSMPSAASNGPSDLRLPPNVERSEYAVSGPPPLGQRTVGIAPNELRSERVPAMTVPAASTLTPSTNTMAPSTSSSSSTPSTATTASMAMAAGGRWRGRRRREEMGNAPRSWPWFDGLPMATATTPSDGLNGNGGPKPLDLWYQWPTASGSASSSGWGSGAESAVNPTSPLSGDWAMTMMTSSTPNHVAFDHNATPNASNLSADGNVHGGSASNIFAFSTMSYP